MTRRGAVTQLDKRLEQSAEGWEVTIRWSKGLTTLQQPGRSELLGREAVERVADAQLRPRVMPDGFCTSISCWACLS